MAGAQRRGVGVAQLKRALIGRELRLEVPLRQVEPGGQAGIPAETGRGVAVQVEAALAPGAGDDEGLDEVALYAVEVGRLVVLVEEAERHEEQPGAHRDRIVQPTVDVELLDLELAAVGGGSDGVLELVLGVEL